MFLTVACSLLSFPINPVVASLNSGEVGSVVSETVDGRKRFSSTSPMNQSTSKVSPSFVSLAILPRLT